MKQLLNILYFLVILMINTNHLRAENLDSDDEVNINSNELKELEELDEIETIGDLSIDKEFNFPRDI